MIEFTDDEIGAMKRRAYQMAWYAIQDYVNGSTDWGDTPYDLFPDDWPRIDAAREFIGAELVWWQQMLEQAYGVPGRPR